MVISLSEDSRPQHAAKQLKVNIILPRASLAGGIKSNKLMAEALIRRGHEVRLAYITAPIPMPSPLRVRTYLKRLWHDFKYQKKIGHHLEESTAQLIPVDDEKIRSKDVPDADFTIATWWETADWIRDWPDSKGIKAHFVRGNEIFAGDPEKIKATYRLPYLKFVISNWLQRMMAEEYGNKDTILVPNGVDRNQFDSQPRSKASVPTVGFMYSLHPLKNIESTLQALRKVQEEIPQLRVVSFGGKPINKKHILPSNFEFHLSPPQAYIPELYRSTDCWIISSTSEGFYMPGIEAAACRCPLVSTRCGGPEDYIKEGQSGFLIKIGDADEMAKRILDIIRLDEPKWKAMSEASYQLSLEFDWDRSAEILEKALLSAMD